MIVNRGGGIAAFAQPAGHRIQSQLGRVDVR
jgi:hypothetical protein